MSREALRDFVRAAEHSAGLRRELHDVSEPTALIALAKRYGFAINLRDLEDDERCEQLEAWFKSSWIRH